MKKRGRAYLLLGFIILVSLIFTTIFVVTGNETETVSITILQTSDIHGMIFPYDYKTRQITKYSMANIASAIKEERRRDPELLLMDTGDTTRGNLVEEFHYDGSYPAVEALNYLDYNVWTIGNHEFNFGFEHVQNQIEKFTGSVICGNAYKTDSTRFSKAWQIFNIKGVRVAVFGITAPHIPYWEGDETQHYDNMTFTEPIDETGKILKELEGNADVIIGNIHYGLSGRYNSLGVEEIAQKYAQQIDGLFIGHLHAAVNERVSEVPILEPADKGKYVSKMVFTMQKNTAGYEIIDVSSELIDVTDYSPDMAFLMKFAIYHDKLMQKY